MTRPYRSDCEGYHRRDVLALGTAGLLGLTLPDLLRLEARGAGRDETTFKPKAKSVIMIWLAGGPASIDMWDLKPNAPDTIRGEFRPATTNVPGIEISEHMPKMRQTVDKVSIVRSICHTIPSHEIATVFMTTGNKPIASLNYPSLGSLASRLLSVDKGVPPYVAFGDLRGGRGGQAGFLGTGYNPFVVEGNFSNPRPVGRGPDLRVRGIQLPANFTQDELTRRDELLKRFDRGLKTLDESADLVDGLDTFHQQALDILRSDKTKVAFDLAKEPAGVREKYGTGPGMAALAARRLVEAGVRFVTITIGGWDTHQSTFTRHKSDLQPKLDTVLSALVSDLDERGLLDSTIVYCAGEFGRTPKVNDKAGRDHWARSMAVVLAGGGFRRGYVHGATDANGAAPATDPVSPDDIAATIFHNLGIDPYTELQTPTGRPIQLFREGKVVEQLIG